MEDRIFKKFDEVADSAAEKCEGFLKSDAVREIAAAIQRLSAEYGYSVSLTCGLEVFDMNRGKTLSLLKVSLTTNGDGGAPYMASGDSSPTRYWVRGTICTVPHDHCPACWGKWDFKFKNTTCVDCGVQMGNEVKHMLDSDVCPNCESGKITRTNPVCDKCAFKVDPNQVVWG